MGAACYFERGSQVSQHNLEMGGRVDDVTLVLAPPEGIDEVDAFFEERFARFDVAHAQCFDPVERDRLLVSDHRSGLWWPRPIQRIAQGRRGGSAKARRGHATRRAIVLRAVVDE